MEYFNIIKGELKKGISTVKDNIMKTELERKLKKATSNEHCHANVTLLNDISRRTNSREDFAERLKDNEYKIKSLFDFSFYEGKADKGETSN